MTLPPGWAGNVAAAEIIRLPDSSSRRSRGFPRRYQRLSPEQLDLACALYRSGLSLTKVGKRLGRPAETVRQALTRTAIEIRPRNGRIGPLGAPPASTYFSTSATQAQRAAPRPL